MPAAGASTTISLDATGAIEPQAAKIIESAHNLALISPDQLLYYFVIGLVGAAGGLFLKIIWTLIKRIFPKLKKLDK